VGLLDNITQTQYYQGNNHGNYQFTSLEDVISQFEVGFVGQDKIIPKVKRSDIAFHARQALRELCFDTLKSCKSQEIKLPASLSMILPHDYINYVRVSWVDSAGIKHPLYYTNSTNNPFAIAQNEDGTYQFETIGDNIVNEGDFTDENGNPIEIGVFWKHPSAGWMPTWHHPDGDNIPYSHWNPGGAVTTTERYRTTINSTGAHHGVLSTNQVTFSHIGYQYYSYGISSRQDFIFQEIDVTNKNFIDLYGEAQAVSTAGGATGVLQIGLSTHDPVYASGIYRPFGTLFSGFTGTWQLNALSSQPPWFDLQDSNGNPSFLEWTNAENTLTKSMQEIDVTSVNTVYLIINSRNIFTTDEYILGVQETNYVSGATIVDSGTVVSGGGSLTSSSNGTSSVTLNNYNSTSPSQINNGDYNDGTFLPMQGERYGLDPQYAQTNGSFYIDCANGKINFSSNLAGKTIILDYISDALGTDKEMQVHKFAEEAMYKYIVHAIIESSSYGQALVPSLTKEKAAAMKQAKIRLSNIKLEELTQVLRGKSKQIKH